MSRVRGPLGVLAVAVVVGVATGLLAIHLVLAAWTYRDAGRREGTARGAWTVAVLVGGLVGFVPYLLARGAGRPLEDGLLGSLADLARAVAGMVRWHVDVARRLAGLAGSGVGLVGRVLRLGLRVLGLPVRMLRAVVRVVRRLAGPESSSGG